MKTSDFLKVAENLAKTGLIRVSKKGEHEPHQLGSSCIGGTDRKNTKLWKNYGTLENIIIFKTAEEANEILKAHGVTEFVAKNTRSKTMCRLFKVKK
jgi:hypothetical protein